MRELDVKKATDVELKAVGFDLRQSIDEYTNALKVVINELNSRGKNAEISDNKEVTKGPESGSN